MTRKTVNINFFTPDAINDPFPLYEEIRQQGNVVWNEALHAWMVMSFRECSTVLTYGGDKFGELNGDPELIYWFDAPNMITVDGAEHRRLRGALAPLFTRSAVAKWDRRVGEVVDELLAELVRSSTFDLIADFTMIPTIIVAEMLGVPQERHGDFRRWSHDIITNLTYGNEDAATRELMRTTAVEINAYLREEMDRHRRDRPDDLLTTMIELADKATMTDAEIRSTAVLFLLAGYDTTAKTMAVCLETLEAHPDQRRLVAERPDLVPDAIEEVLRWSGPVQIVPRQATANVTLGGSDLQAGEMVFSLIGAANHDPARWPHPERFDIQREPKSHFAFGWGPHLCLGAPLARLETKVALEGLLAVAPEYVLRDVDYGEAFFTRGPEHGLVDVGTS